MTRSGLAVAAVLALGAFGEVGPAGRGPGRRKGPRLMGSFAASYVGVGVTNVSATTQRTSLLPGRGPLHRVTTSSLYPGGGSTNCPWVRRRTGENQPDSTPQGPCGRGEPESDRQGSLRVRHPRRSANRST